MKYRITIIAGVCKFDDGTIIPRDYRNNAIMRIMVYACDKFGGYTERQHRGGWRNADGNIVTEDGRSWEIVVDGPYRASVTREQQEIGVIAQGRAFALFVRSSLQQSSVILTVEPLAYCQFVDGTGVTGKVVA